MSVEVFYLIKKSEYEKLKSIELKYLSKQTSNESESSTLNNSLETSATKEGFGQVKLNQISNPGTSAEAISNQIPLTAGHGFQLGKRNSISDQISSEILPQTVVDTSEKLFAGSKSSIPDDVIIKSQWKRHAAATRRILAKLKSCPEIAWDQNGVLYMSGNIQNNLNLFSLLKVSQKPQKDLDSATELRYFNLMKDLGTSP